MLISAKTISHISIYGLNHSQIWYTTVETLCSLGVSCIRTVVQCSFNNLINRKSTTRSYLMVSGATRRLPWPNPRPFHNVRSPSRCSGRVRRIVQEPCGFKDFGPEFDPPRWKLKRRQPRSSEASRRDSKVCCWLLLCFAFRSKIDSGTNIVYNELKYNFFEN